jgi:hypothetical protein
VPLLDDEPVELGDEVEDEPLGVDDVELLEPEVDGEVDGDDGVDVLGEADGVVLPGRSPTRSVRLSLQAVSRPRLSATAKTAERNFFISMPPPKGCATSGATCNAHAATPWLDRPEDSLYQCGSDRGSKGDA